MSDNHNKNAQIVYNQIQFNNWNNLYSFSYKKYKIITHGWHIRYVGKTANYKTVTVTVVTTISTTSTIIMTLVQ